MAQHIRDGRYEAFSDVLADPLSGLTHAALVANQCQRVKDAEHVLSDRVDHDIMIRFRGIAMLEANYVRIVAQWHESSDGRGLSQLQ